MILTCPGVHMVSSPPAYSHDVTSHVTAVANHKAVAITWDVTFMRVAVVDYLRRTVELLPL